MVDLENDDEWVELGKSKAWSWQQGCMLQFVPGSDSLVIWNDRQDNRFVSHLLNIYTKQEKILPFAIYALSPDGEHAVTTDFERIQDTRPGYGYAGIPDPNRENLAPDNAGIYLCNLKTGEKKLIVTYAQMVNMPMLADDAANADRMTQKNWFNHLLFNTDGSRFIFLHRWKAESKKDVGGFATLMYTSDLEGKDIRLVDPSNYTSHFIWRDKDHIAAWTRQPSHGPGFYVFTDGKPEETYVLNQEKMPVNGHNTYIPGEPEWILNDTYPDKQRFQHVYLYNLETDVKIPLGSFFLPSEYKGEWRCDTHPRASRNGKIVCIDCPTSTGGRQLVLLDISGHIN
jgi:heme-degrading monooxygenase HmoA